MTKRAWVGVIIGLAAGYAACGNDPERARRGEPSASASPLAPTGAAASPAAGTTAVVGESGPPSVTLAASAPTDSVVVFPPRNEPFDFRSNALEAEYRDRLRRSATSSFVDIEGAIVWTQEYLRYRVNLCSHQEAVQKVLTQISGGGIAATCGNAPSGRVNFPPRNEPFDFRTQLEQHYRTVLGRGAVQTFVDTEGDIVWTQEYLRYRVSTCSHADSVQKVLDQIRGQGIKPDCAVVEPEPEEEDDDDDDNGGGGGGGGGPVVLTAKFEVEGTCTFDGGFSSTSCFVNGETSGPNVTKWEWFLEDEAFGGQYLAGTGMRTKLGMRCGFPGNTSLNVPVRLVVTDNTNKTATVTKTVKMTKVSGC